MILVNIFQPFSIQFDKIDEIYTRTLPWGENIVRVSGQRNPLFVIASLGLAASFIYVFYALISKYRASRQVADLSMLFAATLFLITAILGTLSRYGIILFFEPGAFGLLAMVMVMSLGLTREIQNRIRTSEQQYRSLFNSSPTSLVAIDAESRRIVQANKTALSFSGFREDELIGKTAVDLAHPDDFDLVKHEQVYDQLKTGLVDSLSFDRRYLRKNGSSFYGHSTISTLRDSSGKVVQLIASTIDVTERKQADERFRHAVEAAPNAMVMVNDLGIIVLCNKRTCTMFGFTDVELIGQHINLLIPNKYHDIHQQHMERFRAYPEARLVGVGRELIGQHKDGSRIPVEIGLNPLKTIDGSFVIASVVDITERKKHEEELIRVAHFDALTGIPNRILLADRMQQGIAQTAREQNMMAVCYLDIDEFKPVNDTLGHEAGDNLLVEITKRIGSVIRGGDTCARLGGDEFVLLLLGLSQGDECAAILERLLVAIAEPIKILNTTASVTASIGISIYPLDNEDPDTLLRHADQAMYIAKQSGKNRYHMYDVALDLETRNQTEFLINIRKALEQNQFELFYQPKINLRTKELVGAEALIRWRHPERGVLPPSEFLRFVENSGLDIAMGDWVASTALAQLVQWRKDGLDIEISINISGFHLESAGFVDKLKQLLSHYPDLPEGKFQIEVLETVALNDINVVQDIIDSCRALGVRFALDDFGTGYSSLSYLNALPVDALKIDQTFVRDMLEDEGDRAIVVGVIALAKAFHRQTVAEGIETTAHIQVLDGMGCELGQGYGIARPMPANELINWKSSYR